MFFTRRFALQDLGNVRQIFFEFLFYNNGLNCTALCGDAAMKRLANITSTTNFMNHENKSSLTILVFEINKLCSYLILWFKK